MAVHIDGVASEYLLTLSLPASQINSSLKNPKTGGFRATGLQLAPNFKSTTQLVLLIFCLILETVGRDLPPKL